MKTITKQQIAELRARGYRIDVYTSTAVVRKHTGDITYRLIK